ncbi:thiamine pyrophosphate-dependent dehydrogenase E1 component subunit alpha [Rubritalea squalenifaciens]|uniref:thiamine pyrophosphate-dependent dehydrogenase E1 component subunit alpha n=1 Tax=Rubritalea squalenifaciens TaxID=407226 RepID=UPI001F3FB921|nr:thiamine pyrophosphate-dependent dehydrogenase E1 component subunit alpha [Rubritalea squalenifaciens]
MAPVTEEASKKDYSQLDRDHVRKVYKAMVKARVLETKLSSLYKAGKIVGGVYLGKGQEAVSASLGACLEFNRDIFAPLIRDQAGRTAMGEDPLDATRTYLGSAEGPMRGRDGNIHRGRPKGGMFAMISHLGASVSMVGGALLARRIQGKLEGCVGAACIGDGGTSTGAFHEGLNMVAVEKLPMVVVIADNQFAYSTPTNRQYACEDLADRAKGYGVAGHTVDGTDFLATCAVMQGAVDAARRGEGPQLVVAKLLRLSGHGEHDDGSYVPQQVRESHFGQDCLDVGRAQLTEYGMATEEEIDTWWKESAEEVQAATATAQRESAPNPYTEEWSAYSCPQFKA